MKIIINILLSAVIKKHEYLLHGPINMNMFEYLEKNILIIPPGPPPHSSSPQYKSWNHVP